MTARAGLSKKLCEVYDTALQKGIQKRDADMISVALKNGAEPDILAQAVVDGSMGSAEEYARLSLQAGADPNIFLQGKWIESAAEHVVACARMALEKNGNPSVLAFNALAHAPKDGFWDDGATLNRKKTLALDLAKLAVEFGADMHAKKKHGGGYECSYVLWADRVKNRPDEALRLLVENGADINEKDKDGETALMFALSRKGFEDAKFYLSLGADPLAANRWGQFPLQWLEEQSGFSGDQKYELMKLMMAAIDKQKAVQKPAAAEEPAVLALDKPIVLPEPLKLIKKPEPKHGGIQL